MEYLEVDGVWIVGYGNNKTLPGTYDSLEAASFASKFHDTELTILTNIVGDKVISLEDMVKHY